MDPVGKHNIIELATCIHIWFKQKRSRNKIGKRPSICMNVTLKVNTQIEIEPHGKSVRWISKGTLILLG
jgi:hypothetical protein